jgi:hypothetical protein
MPSSTSMMNRLPLPLATTVTPTLIMCSWQNFRTC